MYEKRYLLAVRKKTLPGELRAINHHSPGTSTLPLQGKGAGNFILT